MRRLLIVLCLVVTFSGSVRPSNAKTCVVVPDTDPLLLWTGTVEWTSDGIRMGNLRIDTHPQNETILRLRQFVQVQPLGNQTHFRVQIERPDPIRSERHNFWIKGLLNTMSLGEFKQFELTMQVNSRNPKDYLTLSTTDTCLTSQIASFSTGADVLIVFGVLRTAPETLGVS